MTLRELLREKTRSLHQQLDLSVSEGDPFHSLAGYSKYLISFHQLHSVFAEDVQQIEALASIPSRSPSLCELIEGDLEELDCQPAPSSIRASTAENNSESWGRVYVLEGSALGGKHVLSRIEENLDQPPTRFLKQVASDTKNRWVKFSKELSDADIDPEVAAQAAIAAFQTASRIFKANS